MLSVSCPQRSHIPDLQALCSVCEAACKHIQVKSSCSLQLLLQESSISEKIKELRTDLKMNQKNFSAAIGIRQSTLSSYENGVVTPSNDVLLTIAQKFHVSLDWLFGLSENKVQISTLSDIIWVLLQMNESNELRYELDINNKLSGDIETETQKWYHNSINLFTQQKNPGNLTVPGYLTFGHNVPCDTQYI